MADVMDRHPETALVPYVEGQLRSPERDEIARHVAACPRCHRIAENHRALLEELRASRLEPPAVDWSQYERELRAKLRARSQRHVALHWRAWRPVPLAFAAMLVGVLVFLATGSGLRPPSQVTELTPVEETILGDRLDLLRHYSMLEQLDLLEDLEIIRNLDRLPRVRRG